MLARINYNNLNLDHNNLKIVVIYLILKIYSSILNNVNFLQRYFIIILFHYLKI